MIPTIAVRAAAAATGPGVGSVITVTAHRTAVSRTQIQPSSLDADFIGSTPTQIDLSPLLKRATQKIAQPRATAGKVSRFAS
jgi:hypothetical protein